MPPPDLDSDHDLGLLPSFLAVPVQQWRKSDHPRDRLWRICETAEVLLRFVAAVRISDVAAQHDGKLPPKFREALANSMRWPTLGQWMQVVEGAFKTKEFAARHSAAVALCESFERRGPLWKLATQRDGPGGSLESVHALRNFLAHGGGISKEYAKSLLENSAIEKGVESIFADEWHWLSTHEVLFVRSHETSIRLHGAAEIGAERRQVAFLADRVGEVVLIPTARDDQCSAGGPAALSLAPILGYGPPRRAIGQAAKDADAKDAPLVYVRDEGLHLLFNALAGDPPVSYEPDAPLRHLRALFACSSTEAAQGSAPRDFESEAIRDREGLIGREAELEAIIKEVQGMPRGVLWIAGRAGIGKSMLMGAAAAARALCGDSRKLLRVFHRFRFGDARCSRSAFLRHAVERLRAWKVLAPEVGAVPMPESGDLRGLDEEFTRLLRCVHAIPAVGKGKAPRRPKVVFLLDGLDEAARVDPTLPRIALEHLNDGVVWVCAGRPEPELLEIFAEIALPDGRVCRHLFPAGGLGRMGYAEVRSMLLELGKTHAIEMLKLDDDTSGRDGRPKTPNPWIDAIVRRADGLPLYVKLVLDDLLRGKIEPSRQLIGLPASLDAYYLELCNRYAISDLHQVLTATLARLAVARSPLSIDALAALAVHGGNFTDADSARPHVQRALGIAASIVRPAPTDEGGEGFAIDHHSFRTFLCADTSPIRDSLAAARRNFATAALAWKHPDLEPLRPYLLRHGLRHLLADARRADAEEVAFDWRFLEAKAEAGLVYELVDDLQSLGEMRPPLALTEQLRLLGRGLGRDGAWIAEEMPAYPPALFQCLWNTCWWHDCPDAAAHYRKPEGGWPPEGMPWEREERPLSAFMERWRSERRWTEAHPAWTRSLRPPAIRIDSPLRLLLPHRRRVTDADFSSDGRRIVTASEDGLARVWDAASGRLLRPLEGHTDLVRTASFSPDGRRVATTSEDGTARIWDADSGACNGPLEARSPKVLDAAWAPDGCRLATIHTQGVVQIWDAASRALIRTINCGSHVRSIAFSRYDARLAIASCNVGLWDPASGECIMSLSARPDTVVSVAFSSDGRRIVTAARFTAQIWDATTGQCHVILDCAPNGFPYGVELQAAWFTPEPDQVATLALNGTLRRWKATTGDAIDTLVVDPQWSPVRFNWPMVSAISRDGGLAFIQDSRDVAQVWDVMRGTRAAVLDGHFEAVHKAAFSADGRLVLTRSDDACARVWDSRSASTSALLNGVRRPWRVDVLVGEGGRDVLIKTPVFRGLLGWRDKVGDMLIDTRTGVFQSRTPIGSWPEAALLPGASLHRHGSPRLTELASIGDTAISCWTRSDSDIATLRPRGEPNGDSTPEAADLQPADAAIDGPAETSVKMPGRLIAWSKRSRVGVYVGEHTPDGCDGNHWATSLRARRAHLQFSRRGAQSSPSPASRPTTDSPGRESPSLAQQRLEASLSKARESNDFEGVAGSLSALADHFAEAGRFEESIAAYREAIDARNRLDGDWADARADLWCKIAGVHEVRGSVPAAIDAEKECLKKQQSAGNSRGAWRTALRIAGLGRALQDPLDEMAWQNLAFDIAREQKDRLEIALCLMRCAARREEPRPQEALEAYREAIDTGMTPTRCAGWSPAFALFRIAQIHLDHNETEMATQAIKEFRAEVRTAGNPLRVDTSSDRVVSLAVHDLGGDHRLWSVDLPAVPCETGGHCPGVAFSPDGCRLLITTLFAVQMRNAKTGELLWSRDVGSIGPLSHRFSIDGKRLVAIEARSIGGDGATRILNVETGECERQMSADQMSSYFDTWDSVVGRSGRTASRPERAADAWSRAAYNHDCSVAVVPVEDTLQFIDLIAGNVQCVEVAKGCTLRSFEWSANTDWLAIASVSSRFIEFRGSWVRPPAPATEPSSETLLCCSRKMSTAFRRDADWLAVTEDNDMIGIVVRQVEPTGPPKADPSAMRVPTGPGWALETLDETDATHP